MGQLKVRVTKRHTLRTAVVTILALSLLASVGTYVKEAKAEHITSIDIDLSGTAQPEDFPFGIECGDPDFVFVTIFEQGLLAKVDKIALPNGTHTVQLIDGPNFTGTPEGMDFYTIARDPNTGNLFINEQFSGKAWRFDPSKPSDTAWTRIPLVPQIIHPNVTYPITYPVAPINLLVDESFAGLPDPVVPFPPPFASSLGVVFANNFIWIGLTFLIEFDDVANSIGINDTSFSGLARVDPNTLEVALFPIVDDVFDPDTFGTKTRIATINVDKVDPTMIWVPDLDSDKIFRFDTNALGVVQEIALPEASRPSHIDTDDNNLFVALNIPNESGEVTEEGPFSLIAKINRETPEVVEIINTTAPNIATGTFSVFVNGGLLTFTDQSAHVGTIDLVAGDIIVETTLFGGVEDFDSNHFGCVPFDGEFWFASRGSAHVGILPNSKYIGGRPVRATGSGGGGAGLFRSRDFAFGNPDDPRYDSNAPVIEDVLVQEGSLKIVAKITDTVGVEGAQVIVGKKIFSMSPHAGSQSWWYRVFTSDDLPDVGDTLLLKIVAWDYNKNKVEHSVTVNVPFGALSSQGASFAIRPLSAVDHQAESTYSITASGTRPNDPTINPQITIKNTSTEPIQNIRLILSPELKGKFLLSDYAIKSIPAGSEYTVSLKLNGKSNVDAMNNPIPYSGHVIISVDNRTPYILEISGNVPNESASLQSLFMNMISNKAENRYKTFEKPDLRISQDADYKITLGSGDNMVKGSDELIITNTSDKPLKNLRIMISSISEHIMPDQRNIDLLPAGSFVKVKLVSKLNDAEYARDLQGEIIVAPENGKPVSVPINIGKQLQKDKNEMYEVNTISGSYTITHTYDSIIIRNNSEESIDNVRIILPQELARIFALSEDSFKSIEPNGEMTVHIKLRGTVDSSVRQILNEYSGDIIIVSSDGMKKIVPLNIGWKGISSEHFVINARDDAQELTKAAQVINFLERSYPEVMKIVGKAESKTVMYMTSSLDEVKMLSNALAPSTYVYDEDVGFVWSNSEDVNVLALKEFTYRTIMQNYGTYWMKQKVSADKGNWLIDGVSTYVTASIAGERGMIRNNLDAFIAEPASFEWYGAPTPSQSGASHTLFNFLAEKYGESIIDRALTQLGSTIVSNNRCETIEQCALLNAVYDANGWSVNDKRYDLKFDTLIEEWKQYVLEKYSISIEN